MKNFSRITGGLAIALLVFVLYGCKVTVPEVTDVRNVQFVTNEKGEFGIQAEIKVDNPNSFSISVKKLKMDIFIDDKAAGSAKGDKNVKIKAHSHEYHTVFMKADSKQMAEMGLNLIGMFTGQMSMVTVKGGGKGCAYCFFCKKFDIEHSERVRMNSGGF